MECTFLKVGAQMPCTLKSTKNSKYCKMHNFLNKNSKVKPCLICGKGTYAKYQVCVSCGAQRIRLNHRYHEVYKPFVNECKRLRNIELDIELDTDWTKWLGVFVQVYKNTYIFCTYQVINMPTSDSKQLTRRSKANWARITISHIYHQKPYRSSSIYMQSFIALPLTVKKL